MRAYTCCFIGHSECYGLSPERVQTAIEGLIDRGVTDFLCGGMGDFDWMCARMTYGLKRKHSHIRCNLVIPYLTFRVLEPKYFDSTSILRALRSITLRPPLWHGTGIW